MAIKVKPMSYGPVRVAFNDEHKLSYSHNGSELSMTPSLESPAVMLLYSIASCMTLSLQMLATRKKIELSPFYFEVIGHKGTELPVHFAEYEITLNDSVHPDRAVAEQLLKDAKGICTISNSLSGRFNLILKD